MVIERTATQPTTTPPHDQDPFGDVAGTQSRYTTKSAALLDLNNITGDDVKSILDEILALVAEIAQENEYIKGIKDRLREKISLRASKQAGLDKLLRDEPPRELPPNEADYFDQAGYDAAMKAYQDGKRDQQPAKAEFLDPAYNTAKQEHEASEAAWTDWEAKCNAVRDEIGDIDADILKLSRDLAEAVARVERAIKKLGRLQKAVKDRVSQAAGSDSDNFEVLWSAKEQEVLDTHYAQYDSLKDLVEAVEDDTEAELMLALDAFVDAAADHDARFFDGEGLSKVLNELFNNGEVVDFLENRVLDVDDTTGTVQDDQYRKFLISLLTSPDLSVGESAFAQSIGPAVTDLSQMGARRSASDVFETAFGNGFSAHFLDPQSTPYRDWLGVTAPDQDIHA